jgi:hypothetical protein
VKRVWKTPILFVFIVTIIFSGFFTIAFGHEGCLETSLGEIVCPPPMGGIAKNSLDKIVCGKGQCVKTNLGSIQCSKQTGGYAYINRVGHAVCTEGCEVGSSAMCQTPVEAEKK